MASGSGNYGDDLGRRFAGRYEDWRSNNCSPQTRDEYDAGVPTSQTVECTRLAAIYYSINNDGVELRDLDPVDSHAFDCSWTAPGDNRRCFHAVFKADTGTHGHGIRFFFAEILGDVDGGGPPRQVRHCVMLGGRSTWSTNNCWPCSGLWHPRETGSFDYGRK